MTDHWTIEDYRRHIAAGGPKPPQPAKANLRCPVCERREALLTLVQCLLEAGHQLRIEHRFHPTRRWRFDLALPELWLAVEIDGGGWVHGRHHREEGRQADEEKRQAAESLGWRVLRVSWEHVRSGEALSLIRLVIEKREVEP